MFVCASTECFPDMPLSDAFQTLVDLEYTAVEVALHEAGQLSPSLALEDPNRAYELLRGNHRLALAALSLDIAATQAEDYFEQFAACCKLAKATKIVALVVPSAELGTPYNAEIERLQELVRIASFEGAVVALKTETGCMTQDPDTAAGLCTTVKGLGLTLDPSHYIFGPHQGRSFDKVLPHVVHVHLRDTKKDEFQVRVGQGEVEYSRLISQLWKLNYRRALCVNMKEIEGVDHRGEMRKIRLLLDSFL